MPNRVTAEVKLAATAIVDDPVYRRNLYAAMIDRTVAPAIEQMLWFYAKGKPKETIAADGSFSIRWLREADDELARQTDRLPAPRQRHKRERRERSLVKSS